MEVAVLNNASMSVSHGSGLSRKSSLRPATSLSRRDTKSKRTSIFTFRAKPSTQDTPEHTFSSQVTQSNPTSLQRSSSFAAHDADNDRDGYRRSRFFFSRGRKEKGQDSPLRSESALESVSEYQEAGTLSNTQSESSKNEDSEDRTSKSVRKTQISAPFNFQHLTHASPPRRSAAHRRTLLEGSTTNRPTTSDGLEAEQLKHGSRAIDGLLMGTTTHASDAPKLVPTGATRMLEEEPDRHTADANASQASSLLHHSTNGSDPPPSPSESFDEFSPAVGPTINPPRSSSKLAMAHMHHGLPGSDIDSPNTNDEEEDMGVGSTSDGVNLEFLHQLNYLWQETSEPTFQRSTGMTHALTTPDDSARPAMFSIDADGDAMQDLDGSCDSVSVHQETLTYTRTPTSSISHCPITPPRLERESVALEHGFSLQQRFSPPTKSRKACAMAQLPCNLRSWPSPVLDVASTRPEWFTLPDPESSWEEDIDFCYEHAAEADCDFDWNTSVGNTTSLSGDYVVSDTHHTTVMHSEHVIGELIKEPESIDGSVSRRVLKPGDTSTDAFRPSLLLPDENYVPEPNTETSHISAGPELFLRQFNSSSSNFSQPAMEPLVVSTEEMVSSSLFPPPNYAYPSVTETSFEDGFVGYEKSGDMFPLYSRDFCSRPSLSSYSQSSGTLLSKSSSFESIPMAVSVQVDRVRGSAGSFGSLPELIHSRQRAEYPFERVSSGTRTTSSSLRTMSTAAMSETEQVLSSDDSVATQHPFGLQRKRSVSDSATEALSKDAAEAKPRERSRSSTVSRSLSKPSYSLFPSSSACQLSTVR